MFTGISLRAETQLQLPGSFTLEEDIPPSPGHPPGETLQESMTRLDRGLTSGTLLLKFEVRCECVFLTLFFVCVCAM